MNTTTYGAPTKSQPNFFTMCCAPFTSCFPTSSRGRSKSLSTSSISWPLGRTSDQDLLIEQDVDEKSAASIIHDQPSLQVSPEVGYREATRPRRVITEKDGPGFEKRHKLSKSYGSSRTSVSMRNGRTRSGLSSRGRPQISGPMNFIHVASGTPERPVFNPQARPNPPQRRSSFERLELSIYQPSNRLSAMLPHFEFPLPSAPPAAFIRDSQLYDGSATYTRKYSTASFHVPRRGLDSSPSSTDGEIPPLVPRKALGRARAYTSPDVARRVESIASGMNEIERLKKQIDEVMERQSLYVPSRPGTPHSMAQTMPDLATEPLPDIPALPPSAPSFAERLKDDVVRPSTAPLNTASVASPVSTQAYDEATDTFVTTPLTPTSPYRNMPPPLPLVLRPPLRKKKSFSVVSNWLKTPRHSRHISLESVTNMPRPVKGTDGFYQCVPVGGSYNLERTGSFGSIGSVETWDSDAEEDEDERRTKSTTYSQGGTPVKKPVGEVMAEIHTNGTFGRGGRR